VGSALWLQPVADVVAVLTAGPAGEELAGESAALAEFRDWPGVSVPARSIIPPEASVAHLALVRQSCGRRNRRHQPRRRRRRLRRGAACPSPAVRARHDRRTRGRQQPAHWHTPRHDRYTGRPGCDRPGRVRAVHGLCARQGARHQPAAGSRLPQLAGGRRRPGKRGRLLRGGGAPRSVLRAQSAPVRPAHFTPIGPAQFTPVRPTHFAPVRPTGFTAHTARNRPAVLAPVVFAALRPHPPASGGDGRGGPRVPRPPR
jgi:hypothetical protein